MRSHHTRQIVVFCLLLTAFCLPAYADPPSSNEPLNVVWQDVTHNLQDADLFAVAADPMNPRQVFLGTGRALYRTQDGGRTWDQRLVRGAVRAILVTANQRPCVYAGTDAGLWVSCDHGAHWRRASLAVRPCLALLQDADRPARLWAGTGEGVFRSDDDGHTWRALGGATARRQVTVLGRPPADAQTCYAATDTGLLMTADDGQTWRPCLLARATGEETDAAVQGAEETSPTYAPSDSVTSLAFNPERPQDVVALMHGHALISQDRGQSWTALPTTGLSHDTIHSAVMTHASAARLYVATDHGVWTFEDADRQWRAVYRGMTARRVRQLAVQPQDGTLWAATDRGVFHGVALPVDGGGPISPLRVWALFQHEPSVDEVQRWAIRYSETDPAKIARWRRQAAAKALLPTVSFSVARNNTANDHYDEGTYPKFQLVPTRDLDRNLGVSVSWNLSELIWNDDQTSIDTRSKLTTELRDQIAAEVTQLYFERRRLQMDGALQPAPDPARALQQALRVDELTAQIDALTGGRFRQALEGGK